MRGAPPCDSPSGSVAGSQERARSTRPGGDPAVPLFRRGRPASLAADELKEIDSKQSRVVLRRRARPRSRSRTARSCARPTMAPRWWRPSCIPSREALQSAWGCVGARPRRTERCRGRRPVSGRLQRKFLRWSISLSASCRRPGADRHGARDSHSSGERVFTRTQDRTDDESLALIDQRQRSI